MIDRRSITQRELLEMFPPGRDPTIAPRAGDEIGAYRVLAVWGAVVMVRIGHETRATMFTLAAWQDWAKGKPIAGRAEDLFDDNLKRLHAGELKEIASA